MSYCSGRPSATRRQGRYPLAILHSALAPWPMCVVARVDEGQAEAACLQALGNRTAGYAGHCDRHCLHPAGGRPIHQRIQVWGRWDKQTHRRGCPIIRDIRPRFVTAPIQGSGVRVHTWVRSGTRGTQGPVRMREPLLSGESAPPDPVRITDKNPRNGVCAQPKHRHPSSQHA